MKKTIIWLVMLVFLVSSVSAYWCYQESANVSNSCGGLATGSYKYGGDWSGGGYEYRTYDGDWSTKHFAYSGVAWLISNYTIIADTQGAMVQTKIGDSPVKLQNTTIPTECYSGAKMALNFSITDSVLPLRTLTIKCHNGTEFIYVNNYSTTSGDIMFYEEGVYWNTTTPITINLKDEQTGQILNRSWSTEIWGSDFSTNASSSTYLITLINSSLPSNYNFRYSTTGYATRQYYMLDELDNNINLYTINTSNSLLTLYTITDITATPLDAVTLIAYRKMIASNEWEIVEMSVSDTNGQGTLNLEPYNVNYMFSIYDSEGEVIFSSTTPSTIPSNSIYFRVSTTDTTTTAYDIVTNAETSLTWSNSTGNFTYIWAANGVTDGMLTITRQTGISSAVVCNSNLTASSGTVTCNLDDYRDDTATFVANGWLNVNGAWYISDTLSQDMLGGRISWGLSGALWAFLIIATFAMFGMWNPAAAIAFACLGVIISSMLGLIPIAYTYVAGIVAIGMIGILKVRT